jgi:uncharacterized RDD family membrane protein YckC
MSAREERVEQFWVIRDRMRSGPFSEAEIMRAHRAGELKPTDRLWADGVPEPVTVAKAFEQMGGREPTGDIDLTLIDVDDPRPSRMSRADDDSPYRPPLAPVEDRGYGEVDYAGFWVRYAATVLDALILGILGALVGFVLGLGWKVLGVRADRVITINALAGVIVGWLYVAFGESSPASATWGKRAFHLRVLRADGLDRISFLRASGRFLARYLSILTFMIGYLMQPLNARKRALHDFICGTVVVVERRYSRLLVAACIALALLISIAVGTAVFLTVSQQPGFQGKERGSLRR